MRKLFVLFLLVALVPFTVGCNGLWDFDDDTDPVATKKLSASVKLAKDAVSGGNLRAAFAYDALTMTINGIPFTAVGVTDNGDGTVTVNFEAVVPSTTTISGEVPVVVSLNDTKIAEATVSTPSTGVSTMAVAVAGTFNAGTGVFTATGMTAQVGTTTVTGTGFTATPATVPAPITVASVVAETKTLTTVNQNVVTLDSLTPKFTVTFSKEVTNPTTAAWSVSVKNLTTNVTFDLDNTANKALFTVAPATDKKVVDITIVGDATKKLRAGHSYSVELKSTNLQASDKAGLGTVGTYYFNTKQ